MTAFSSFDNHDFCKESCVWFGETNDGEPSNRLTFITMTFSQKWKHCSTISLQKRKEGKKDKKLIENCN